MIRNLIIAFFISTVIISCEQESDNLLNQNNVDMLNFIDTTIIATDTLNYSFGYFGDEEGILIISESKKSQCCKLLNKQSEEKILQYIPEKDFLGIDSVIIVTMRGSDGASSSADIDTILFLINVVKDDFHKKLIGKWNWTSSCGGYTGGCWYPSKDNHEMIEFDNNMRYIAKYNNSVIMDFQYHIIESFVIGQDTIYEIGLENGYDTYYRFVGDKLNIQGGDFWKEFERIE